jgi:hypothetical protein
MTNDAGLDSEAPPDLPLRAKVEMARRALSLV